MRSLLVSFLLFAVALPIRVAQASDADITTVTIVSQTAGPTPFINSLTLQASNTALLRSIKFTITPKPGSHTRPLSGTYAANYLIDRGYLQSSGRIFLPVYGLYDNFNNSVTLTYNFIDGSNKQASTTIQTAAFADPCGYKNPTVLQARSATTKLSYDYMMVKNECDNYSPAILDTDGALRWVGTGGFTSYTCTFFDNAVYIANGTELYRNDLDGTVTFLQNYSNIGVTYLHHNIDRGKYGIILDADTTSYLESTNIEVDINGVVLRTWNLAAIISSAMLAGGDDPSQFVYPTPDDWFHNNAVTYNRADDSVIVSSRENFLIDLDYSTSNIKWILGDPTKKWHEFPSLAKFALNLDANSLPPIGQHGVSVTFDQDVMVFDNGTLSLFQMPPGANRLYASPRKYQLSVGNQTASEVWNYPMNESIFSPYCGSVYEDAPYNYLVDYALVNGPASNSAAQLLGLDASGNKAFYYQYPTTLCNEAFNSIPLHLENTTFPTVGPQMENISTLGTVSTTAKSLIAGFIVKGTDPKTVAVRLLGPSIKGSSLTDPRLTLFDSLGNVVATNDDWQTDSEAGDLIADGLAPSHPSEAAVIRTLNPGSYTVAGYSKGSNTGLGLAEVYDLTPEPNSRLVNLSTRGYVGPGNQVLISGFILGQVASNSVIIRGLGPSLNLSPALADPVLTIYDNNGTVIATNDNWQDDKSRLDIQSNGLAPTNDSEAATALFLPAGSYTAIESGANGGTGIGLIEVYDLTGSLL